MSNIILLGAEEQAASSFALAWPDKNFTFISDFAVLDGWDIPNVDFKFSHPQLDIPAERECLAMSPRWLIKPWPLSLQLSKLSSVLPGRVLEVVSEPPLKGRWIVKGDLWHRPNGPIFGNVDEISLVDKTISCGVVYQPLCEVTARFITVGRRWRSGRVVLGVVRIHAERFFRQDIIQAAETVDNAELVRDTIRALEALDYIGLFNISWIWRAPDYLLTSFRPVPRAVVGLLKSAGVSLLDEPTDHMFARSGAKCISEIHYSKYKPMT